MTRLHRIPFLFWLGLMLAISPTMAATEDAEGSKDHPLFNRMPNYHIDDYREIEFDMHDGFVDSDGSYLTKEGYKYYISYYVDDGAQAASELQIIRNFTNAIQKIGGTVVYEDTYGATLHLEKGGRSTWVHVKPWNGGHGYTLTIIEEQAMDQVIVADANAMAQDIRLTGKATVYGIYFDTGKAEVKPDSEPTLKEIAKLLAGDPELKLYVVGHTDGVGELDYNMSLSRQRAAAVVEVLVSQYNVPVDRLDAHGVGPLAPVSTNDTEEGRALNRRSELVKQ